MFTLNTNKIAASVLSVALGSLSAAAFAHNAHPPVAAAQDGVAFYQAFRLDGKQLFSLHVGDTVEIAFPVIGKKQVVYESHSPFSNGVAYWHGHLSGDNGARVTLQYDGQGFVGSISYNAGTFALKQGADARLAVKAGAAAGFRSATGDMVGFALDERGHPRAAGKGMYQVELQLDTLSQARENDIVQLPLPDGSKLPLVFVSREVGMAGAVDWLAYSRDNGKAYQATLTYGPDAVFGTVTTPDTVYRIETQGGKTYMVDVRAAGYHNPDSTHYDIDAPTAAASQLAQQAKQVLAKAPTTAKGTTATTGTTTTTTAATTTSATNTVDVLVLFSTTFRQKLGDSAYLTRIQNLFAIANRALSDSQVNGKLRAVFTKEVNYADNDNGVALGDVQASRGAFVGTDALRTQYGADLVTFLRPFSYVKNGGSCGVGYVLGQGLHPEYIPYQSAYAYTVVSDGRDTSTSYYCDDTTFAHEVGHNFGAMHDIAHSGTGKGAYADSFGYGVSGKFGDVMSYYWPKVGVYSNPNLTVCSNAPCGTATANVSRTLNLEFPAVANFKAAAVSAMPATLTLSGTLVDLKTGRAVEGATVTINDKQGKCSLGRNNSVLSCTTVAGASGSISVSVAGRTVTPPMVNYTALSASMNDLRFLVR